MSRFLDGPAGGNTLDHQRAPHFLRVVIDTSGEVDVLDQIADTPRPSETVHVYQQVAGTHTGPVHVCIRGEGKGRSGWYDSADYRHRVDVDGEQLRDTSAWQEWAIAQDLTAVAGECFGASSV